MLEKRRVHNSLCAMERVMEAGMVDNGDNRNLCRTGEANNEGFLKSVQ